MAPPPKASASVKELKLGDGTVTLTPDLTSVIWTPISPRGAPPGLTFPVAQITNLQQTPEKATKVMLRVSVKKPELEAPTVYTFNFNHPTNPRGEANAIKDVLTTLISEIKARAEDTNTKPVAIEMPWYDDAQLKRDVELQQSLLRSDTALQKTYMESRRTKPDSISDSQFNTTFWSTRTNLLRAHAVDSNQRRGAYNVLSVIKPKVVDDVLKVNVSVEQVQLIFSQHPLVKRVYDENVPKLNEMEFWSRFWVSRLLKKLKGERITEMDATDPVFDRYLDQSNDTGLAQRLLDMHIPHTIDLEGNEENQGGQKSGNRKDYTMRPGSSGKVPIVRTLNSLSEKLIAHVAPSDVVPSDPIGMDENTFNQLALRDLQGDPKEHRILLNIKEQSRFFLNEKAGQSKEAATYAAQVPGDILLELQTDIDPGVMPVDSHGGLDLREAIGVNDESDSEDDEQKQPHVGSKASIAAAQKQIFDGIAQRRSQLDPSSKTTQQQASGLSTVIFDRLTLTHATTTEFLHHFWHVFLSGDADRAAELAQLVETLNRALDRINSVAADAEKERQEVILRNKQEIRTIYEKTGKKMKWSPDSVNGGEKTVRAMMEPTAKALDKATREYRKALAAEGINTDTVNQSVEV